MICPVALASHCPFAGGKVQEVILRATAKQIKGRPENLNPPSQQAVQMSGALPMASSVRGVVVAAERADLRLEFDGRKEDATALLSRS